MNIQPNSEQARQDLSKDISPNPPNPQKRKTIRSIFLTLFAILAGGIVLCLVVFGFFSWDCWFVKHSWIHPPVDVSPILNLSLPDDMDLSQWEKPLDMSSGDWRGVWIDIIYFPSIEEADQKFLRSTPYTFNSGESPNRYQLSNVTETTDEFCNGYGSYNSYIMIQKGRHIIEIEEKYAEDRDSQEIEKTIARLAREWAASIHNGNYQKVIPGRLVFEEKCESCHSIKRFTDSQDRYFSDWGGPNLYSLYGSQEELDDGSCITVDKEYLRQSILNPSDKVVFWWGVGGYDTKMKQIEISEDDVGQLVTYLISLADKEFQCRERPAVKGEKDIIGVWYNNVVRLGAILTIKPDGEGGYRIFDGNNVDGECRYDSQKGIYIGGFYFDSENRWSDFGDLTIEQRDANTILMTHSYNPESINVWLFIRQDK